LSPYREAVFFQNHYSWIIGYCNKNEYVKLGIFNFEIEKEHTYFAEILTNKHEKGPEIEKGINKPNRAYYAFPVLKNQQ
jgi:hypothetical protein